MEPQKVHDHNIVKSGPAPRKGAIAFGAQIVSPRNLYTASTPRAVFNLLRIPVLAVTGTIACRHSFPLSKSSPWPSVTTHFAVTHLLATSPLV